MRTEMRHNAQWLLVLVLVGLFAQLALFENSAPARRTTVRWSRGYLADRPTHGLTSVNGLACPSARLCVGADAHGAIIRTRAPASATGPWRRLPQHGESYLAAVSCAGVHFCAALAGPGGGPMTRAGEILTTTRPATASRWARASAPVPGWMIQTAGALACPSRRLCVATVGEDWVLVSTDPTGGTRRWHREPVGSPPHAFDAPQWQAVSCPTARFCLLGDVQQGRVAVSTDPAADSHPWHVSRIAPASHAKESAISSVSCSSSRFCVVGGGNGGVHWSTDPGGGPRAWHREQLSTPHERRLHPPIAAVDCQSVRFCAAVDLDDRPWVSTDPRAGSRTWRTVTLDTGHLPREPDISRELVTLACTRTRLCIAAGNVGDAFLLRTASGPVAGTPSMALGRHPRR